MARELAGAAARRRRSGAGEAHCRSCGPQWCDGRAPPGPPVVLLPRHRDVVRGILRRPHPSAGRGLERHRARGRHPGGGPHGIRQDPRRLPHGDRSARGEGAPGRSTDGSVGRALGREPGRRERSRGRQRPVHLAAQGPRGRCRAQPDLPTGRHGAHRRAARAEPCADQRGRAHRRHSAGRAAPARHPSAGHPHHHPGIAVPPAHLTGTGDPPRRGDGDPRRGARRGRDQARRAPGPVPGASGRDARDAGAEDRSLRDRRARGRGRRLPHRVGALPGGDRGPARVDQGMGDHGVAPGAGSAGHRAASRCDR